jgi:hypothetical protein
MAYKSSINLGLPNLPDPPDPAFMSELIRIYNAIRNLAIAVDVYTGAQAAEPSVYSQTPASSTVLAQNMYRFYVKFDFTATYGKTIYIYDNAGVPTAGLADATVANKKMRGWCSTVAGVTAGQFGEVMLGGLCTAIGGLTAGTVYYNGNTPGSVSSTPGTVSQKVGYALGPTYLIVTPEL